MYALAGDIGGTNTRLIYAEITNVGRNIIAEKNYPSTAYADFYQVLDEFISGFQSQQHIDSICFAIAGPVKHGEVKVTNLPWTISEQTLREKFDLEQVVLINDFIAVAYGLQTVNENDFLIIQAGKETDYSQADAAVIGAGTGLGACHLLWQKDHYHASASEAGHSSFSPQNQQQANLLSWLWKNSDYISLETLLSGRGFLTIYHYLSQVENIAASAAINKEMQSTDAAKVITDHSGINGDELCKQTVDLFIDIYGAAASNVVLHYYPVSVLYIAGGIASKLRDRFTDGRFIKAFNTKGLMTENMKNISIKLSCEERAGLFGALSKAITNYQSC